MTLATEAVPATSKTKAKKLHRHKADGNGRALKSIETMLKSIDERLMAVEVKQSPGMAMPITGSPDQNIQSALKDIGNIGDVVVGIRGTYDYANPGLAEDAWHPRDIVALKPTFWKEKRFRRDLEDYPADKPILGQVLQYLGVVRVRNEQGKVTKQRVRSYKIQWPEGVGKDGETEDNLVFVRRPVS